MPDPSSPPDLDLLPPLPAAGLGDRAPHFEPHLPTPPLPWDVGALLLAVALFLLSFFTCVTLGGGFLLASRTDVVTDLAPALLPETIARVWGDPALLRWGLSFAIPVLLILLAHELGHFVLCRRHRLRSTPPYFLPAPIGLGTFGAFIRIRTPIRDKRVLFDVGVAGPIAGFVLLVPFLIYGVAHSEPSAIQAVPEESASLFLYLPGKSLLFAFLSWIFHGSMPSGTILNPHPFALAAWVGCFATMLNLLPLAQLDGGHLLYAFLGKRHLLLARILWVLLVAGGLLWPGWFLWSVIVLGMGLRHPPVLDEEEPLDRRRKGLALLALLIFALCFMPVPISSIAIG